MNSYYHYYFTKPSSDCQTWSFHKQLVTGKPTYKWLKLSLLQDIDQYIQFIRERPDDVRLSALKMQTQEIMVVWQQRLNLPNQNWNYFKKKLKINFNYTKACLIGARIQTYLPFEKSFPIVLPDDVAHLIFTFLNFNDLKSLRMASKKCLYLADRCLKELASDLKIEKLVSQKALSNLNYLNKIISKIGLKTLNKYFPHLSFKLDLTDFISSFKVYQLKNEGLRAQLICDPLLNLLVHAFQERQINSSQAIADYLKGHLKDKSLIKFLLPCLSQQLLKSILVHSLFYGDMDVNTLFLSSIKNISQFFSRSDQNLLFDLYKADRKEIILLLLRFDYPTTQKDIELLLRHSF